MNPNQLEEEITRAVTRAFLRSRPHDAGMGEEVDEGGDDPLGKLTSSPEFQEAREKIQPWIWVLSIFGFGMALINTHRIKKIFKSWKGARHYAGRQD